MLFSEYLLNEEVYGAMAIGYHRARTPDAVTNIGTTGFSSGGGSGAMYGQ